MNRKLSSNSSTSPRSFHGPTHGHNVLAGINVSGNATFNANFNDAAQNRCLADLRLTDPRDDKKRIEQTKGGLLEDSYKWILDHSDFCQWRNGNTDRLLWVKGDPGKGKTMLLCGVIDELKKDPNIHLSFFFCQAPDPMLNSATAVLRGILYMLITTEPSLIAHVKSKYDNARKQLFEDGNAWFALTEILIDILQQPTQPDRYLILDALDECITNMPLLLDFIAQTSSSHHAKWPVSSRNWSSIEEALQKDQHDISLCLELNEASISHTVDAYIQYKLSELVRRKKYADATRDAVHQHLVANSQDTFLWVSLVCEQLADPNVRKWQTLNKLKSFPPGLDALYERMVKQIQASDDADFCKEILAVMSVSYRPIRLKELVVFAKFLDDFQNDPESLTELICGCGSFLTVKDDVVYFVHQSAKDFLIKVADRVFLSSISWQHLNMFSNSLEVLSKTLRRDIYNLQTPGFLMDDVSIPNPDPLISINYARVYWVDHLDSWYSLLTRSNEELFGPYNAISDFFQQNFLHWLEALSLLGNLPNGVRAIQKLVYLTETSPIERLAAIVKDARQFILYHKSAIEITPLQIYASALVFSPTQSLIKQRYNAQAPIWVSLKQSTKIEWDACIQTLEGHTSYIFAMKFSPDGHRIASFSSGGVVKIWDVATGTCIHTFKQSGLRSFVFLANGRQLAAVVKDQTIDICDPPTGELVQRLHRAVSGPVNDYVSLRLSTDGQWLANNDKLNNRIIIWDITRGQHKHLLVGHNSPVEAFDISPNAKFIASGAMDGIKLWDLVSGTCTHTFAKHNEWVDSIEYPSNSEDHEVLDWIEFSSDSRYLISVTGKGSIRKWDIRSKKCVKTINSDSQDVGDLFVFSSSGKYLASAFGSEIKVFDMHTDDCLRTFKGHRSTTSILFSPDSNLLVSSSRDNTIKDWDMAAEALDQIIKGYKPSVRVFAVAQDFNLLALNSIDDKIKIWDISTGQCIRTLTDLGQNLTHINISRDGRYLVSRTNTMIKISELTTGECIQALQASSDCYAAAFSSDCSRLALVTDHSTIEFSSMKNKMIDIIMLGYEYGPNALSFSTNNQFLASSDPIRIRIWNANIGDCIHTFEHAPDLEIKALALSNNGQKLAIAEFSKVSVYDLVTERFTDSPSTNMISRLSFDLITGTSLLTNIGTLDLDQSVPMSGRIASVCSGYTLSHDNKWIMKDGENILWLPPEHRPFKIEVLKSTIIIVDQLNRLLVMEFPY